MNLFSAADLLLVLSAFGGFVVFLIAHVFGFRTLKTDRISGTIKRSFLWGLITTLVTAIWIVCDVSVRDITLMPAIFGAVLAVLSYSLLFFNYMSLVFGMGEVAIRVRLLRELLLRPNKSASASEICAVYNKQTILLPRLDRLVAAGHLKLEGDHYRIGGRVLFAQAAALRVLGALMAVKRKN